MKIENVPIDSINIGHRYRVERGDIDRLAANINVLGLLQPIGVDLSYQLIFGARRLEACKSVLHWNEIPCVILDLDSILAGEYAENELRKQFTLSERVAIGKAMEEKYGTRHGGDRRSSAAQTALDPEGKTVDIAANRAGFGSAETYQSAKTVVESGAPELVAAVNEGKIPVKPAAAIAIQPVEEQKKLIEMPPGERRSALKNLENVCRDNEHRAYRRLAQAVEQIARFQKHSTDVWAGLKRARSRNFPEHLERAIAFLVRLQNEHPKAVRIPADVPPATQ